MSRSLRVSSKYIANKEKLRFRPEHWEIPSVAEKGWQQRKQSTNQPQLHKFTVFGLCFLWPELQDLKPEKTYQISSWGDPTERNWHRGCSLTGESCKHRHLKCKASHCRNLEIGTLGKAPPCCSRTRHKFEATKCQSHHTWLVCLPNSLSETSSHLIMMSCTSWVSHSKSPMMYPRCPESRYKKEDYSSFHCHNISLFLHQAPFKYPFCLTKHLPNHA